LEGTQAVERPQNGSLHVWLAKIAGMAPVLKERQPPGSKNGLHPSSVLIRQEQIVPVSDDPNIAILL
jgi:hypothetical protein